MTDVVALTAELLTINSSTAAESGAVQPAMQRLHASFFGNGGRT